MPCLGNVARVSGELKESTLVWQSGHCSELILRLKLFSRGLVGSSTLVFHNRDNLASAASLAMCIGYCHDLTLAVESQHQHDPSAASVHPIQTMPHMPHTQTRRRSRFVWAINCENICSISFTYSNGVIDGSPLENPAEETRKVEIYVPRRKKNIKSPRTNLDMCHHSLNLYLLCASGIFFLVHLQSSELCPLVYPK